MDDKEVEINEIKCTLKAHAKEITELKTSHKDMNVTLDSILKTLTKIQYIAYGIAIYYVANEIGFSKVLSKIFL